MIATVSRFKRLNSDINFNNFKPSQMERKTQPQDTSHHDTDVQHELVIHRVFDLPVNKVWKALTEPEEFKKWWGPKDFTCPSSKMEAKVGGKYLSCMKGTYGKEY